MTQFRSNEVSAVSVGISKGGAVFIDRTNGNLIEGTGVATPFDTGTELDKFVGIAMHDAVAGDELMYAVPGQEVHVAIDVAQTWRAGDLIYKDMGDTAPLSNAIPAMPAGTVLAVGKVVERRDMSGDLYEVTGDGMDTSYIICRVLEGLPVA